MARRLTRSYAVANLEDEPVTISKPMKEKKRKRTGDDTASEGDDTLEVPQSPPRPKRGRPPAKKKATETVPEVGEASASGDTGAKDPKPITFRGKTMPLRSPQPSRMNRNTHLGIIAQPKPKRTSAEVAAIAERKADLQRQADEFERKRIELLAEMEIQEEFDDEAEERSVVRKRAEASSLDGVEDVEMESKDGEDTDAPTAETNAGVLSGDDVSAGEKVAPKRKQV